MHQTLAKPRSRADEKAEKKQKADKQKRAVHQMVTRRDFRRCRACNGIADPNALDLLKRGHHHHVKFRSAGGEDSTENLVLLCAGCHADVHAHRLSVQGNADTLLQFQRDGRTWFA